MLFLVVWVLSSWCLHLFGNTLLIPQQSHAYEWWVYELPRDVWKYSILRAFNQNTFCSETSPVPTHLLYTILRSLHSRKLHILGFRARTVCTNSLVIFFFSLSDKGTYHFWSLSLPCRLNRSMNCIWNEEMTQKQRGCEWRHERKEWVVKDICTKRHKKAIQKRNVALFMWWNTLTS